MTAASLRSPSVAPPAFIWSVRVYWEDTDAGGVVFYANYLKYFERARTEWLRSFGIGQEQLRLGAGVMFMVTDTSVRYLRPAKLDDEIEVTVNVLRETAATLTLTQQAWKREAADDTSGHTLLSEGTIRIACVDAGTYRPCRIPMSISTTLSRPLQTAPE